MRLVMLSSREAADRLGFKTTRVIRDWVKRGWLEGVQLPNGQWRFEEEAVARAAQRPPRLSERAQDVSAHVLAARARLRRIARG